jgi:catechol 2,3-dioxygenase-like lactoylglutathione lyase family enzyme
VAPSREQVDEFWRAGTEAGYADDGRPGPRPSYRADYYGAYLLDPDGNSAEAVHHGALRRGGVIDHLWIRVADLAASKRFYDTIAPHAGLRLRHDGADRVQFTGTSGSFSLVPGAPTENLHLAFPTDDDVDVQRFHQAASDAGYHSNGPPGERARYHPGYYAAYVLDPDGNNVEVVNHHRA